MEGESDGGSIIEGYEVFIANVDSKETEINSEITFKFLMGSRVSTNSHTTESVRANSYYAFKVRSKN